MSVIPNNNLAVMGASQHTDHLHARRSRKHYFSLVEVALALVVVAVGFVGVLALLPVGQGQNRDAVMKSGAGDSAEQFVRHLASQLKGNWEVANSIPFGKPVADPAGDEEAAIWSPADAGGVFKSELTSGAQIYYNDVDGDGKFDFRIDDDNPSRDNTGIFKFVQTSNSGSVKDFEAIVRVWRSAATYKAYDAGSTAWSGLKPVPPDAGTTLNVEVSYPVGAAYENRTKKTYSLDVFRPSENALEEVRGAFAIQQSGNLTFTFHGSSAGLTSGLFMHYPEVVEIFEENQNMDQNTVVEVEYEGGTAFNFFSRTYASSWGYGTYDHFAWGEEDSDSPAMVGVPYYDNPGGNDSTGAYCATTGNPYCIVTELKPGSKWLMGFEDLPGWRPPDWDYNDIVVTVEVVSDDQGGVSSSGHDVTGTIRMNSDEDWRLDITRSNGQLINSWNLSEADNGSTYSAIAVWMRPRGNGSQNLSVDGSAYEVENEKMTAVSGENILVKLYRSGGDWHVQIIEAEDAIITTME